MFILHMVVSLVLKFVSWDLNDFMGLRDFIKLTSMFKENALFVKYHYLQVSLFQTRLISWNTWQITYFFLSFFY